MALTMSHVAGPTTPAVREWTFGDLLRRAAESAPDRLALIAGVPDPALRRKWTYAELYREAQRTARALLTRFRKGERIAVWAQNVPEWIMLEFGAGMAGMVLVTVNPAFRANEVQYVLKQSRAAGVFVVNNFRGNPMLETVQAVKPDCPELREVICFDDWDKFIAAGDDTRIELPAVSPDDPVMIQYTSGTTGFPKGALLRHRGLVNNGADTADRMGVDPGDVFITTMPLFHTGGCVCCVMGAVSKAATQVLVEAFEPLPVQAFALSKVTDGRKVGRLRSGSLFLQLAAPRIRLSALVALGHQAGAGLAQLLPPFGRFARCKLSLLGPCRGVRCFRQAAGCRFLVLDDDGEFLPDPHQPRFQQLGRLRRLGTQFPDLILRQQIGQQGLDLAIAVVRQLPLALGAKHGCEERVRASAQMLDATGVGFDFPV